MPRPLIIRIFYLLFVIIVCIILYKYWFSAGLFAWNRFVESTSRFGSWTFLIRLKHFLLRNDTEQIDQSKERRRGLWECGSEIRSPWYCFHFPFTISKYLENNERIVTIFIIFIYKLILKAGINLFKENIILVRYLVFFCYWIYKIKWNSCNFEIDLLFISLVKVRSYIF